MDDNFKSKNISNYVETLLGIKVISFSSQYGKENSFIYTASNLAKPINYFKYPAYGDFEECYLLRTYGPWWSKSRYQIKTCTKSVYGFISKDYVEVAFEKKLFLTSIAIYETYHPGSVVALCAFSHKDDKWIKLWSIFEQNNFKNNYEAIHRQLPPKQSRKLILDFQNHDVYTNLIRLEFEDYCQDYYSEFDAVEVRGYDHSIIERLVGTNLRELSDRFIDVLALDENQNKIINESENILNQSSNIEKNQNKAQITEIPHEIFHFIFQYLDLVSIFKLKQTCKDLYKICSDKLIFVELDLQPYWHLINNSFINLIKNLTEQTTFLNLSWTKNLDTNLLKQLFITSRNALNVLKLSCCQYVDDDMLQFICENCKMINELDLQSCEMITKFQSISNLSDLKKLNLYRTKIKSNDLISIIHSCKSLEYLNIGSCNEIANIDWILQEIALYNPHIKSLELWRVPGIIETGLISLASACAELEELDLGWCKISNYTSLHAIVQKCTKLKKLVLTAVRVTDTELEWISRCLHDLVQLDILGSNSVSTEAVINVLNQCKKLRLFDISFCPRIDMVTATLLSHRYQKCSIKKSFQNQ